VWLDRGELEKIIARSESHFDDDDDRHHHHRHRDHPPQRRKSFWQELFD
jgi:Zn-finger nucleic acid-binding protein